MSRADPETRRDAFAPGGRLRLARRRQDEVGPFLLTAATRELGRLVLGSTATTARLTIGERAWSIDPWGRGWRLAATDARGEQAAWWERARWLGSDRLTFAPEHELSLRHAIAWRPARVRDDGGRVILSAEVLGRHEQFQVLLDVHATPPPGVDPELLVGFVASVLLLHRAFQVPTHPQHPWIPAEGGWFGGDGGGGGGEGGG